MKVKVSIVEDDTPARNILTEWIRGENGFKCVGVHENAETAITALPEEKPSVVLMDINMPGMSGIECVRRLKPLMMETQFLMLTVYEDPDHIFKALSFGATGYLLKRTPRAEVIAAIRDGWSRVRGGRFFAAAGPGRMGPLYRFLPMQTRDHLQDQYWLALEP